MSSINIPSMTSNSEWVSESIGLLLLGSEHQMLMKNIQGCNGHVSV